MIKLLTIVGARPQVIKAAALSRAIIDKFKDKIEEIILDTGQHYDHKMSGTFFGELGIPAPKYSLCVGSDSHGAQTAKMLEGISDILLKENPTAIVVYGDTNSTVAGALAASKLNIPVVHVEAGLRSFNKGMPEEINRILTDHVSTLLFTPTKAGVTNLLNEGFKLNESKATIDNPRVYHCGDVMYDNSLYFSSKVDETFLKQNNLTKDNFVLVTIHRNSNTDDQGKLSSIFKALIKLKNKSGLPIVLPLHPRTQKMINVLLDDSLKEEIKQNITILPPVSFLEMISLETNSKLIVTDSGGVQKEAYFFKKPAIILRPQTEWTEIVENGNNILADADEKKILNAFDILTNSNFSYPNIFGDGKAAEFICNRLLENFES